MKKDITIMSKHGLTCMRVWLSILTDKECLNNVTVSAIVHTIDFIADPYRISLGLQLV
jgi:hypothetical protein